MVLKNVAYLEDHGPATGEDLPLKVTVRHRAAGIRSFTLRGDNGRSASMGGQTTMVYYLDSHGKTAVLRAFLDANPELVEAKSRRALHRLIKNHGTE